MPNAPAPTPAPAAQAATRSPWLAIIAGPLAITDLTERRLPNRIILPSYPILLAALGFAALAEHSFTGLRQALLGMFVTLVLYGVPCLLAPDAIGGGDVKLAALLSLPLAYTSWTALVTASVFTWLLAAAATLACHALGRAITTIPLGPWLIAGALASTLISTPQKF